MSAQTRKWFRRTAYVFISGVAILTAAAVVFAIFYLPDYMKRARGTEAKINLSSMYAATKAFHDEFQNYSAKPEEIGFRLEGKLRGRLYTTAEDIPPEDLAKIPPDRLPFTGKDGFRFIYVMPDQIWSIDQDKKLEQIY